jgi:hypothetical protein
MKKQTSIFVILILLVCGVGCEKKEAKESEKKPETVKLSGSFVDTKGDTIRQGKIEVYLHDGKDKPKRMEFDIADGTISQEIPKANQYVVNVKVKGYGLVSKVFAGTIPNRTYELKKATVKAMSVTSGGLMMDMQNNCAGSWSKRANWSANPRASLPIVLNSQGQISGLGMSPSLQAAYDFHAKSAPCNSGISITIPPNSIKGVGSPDSVSVAMSAIDLFSPDGMPGDNTSQGGLMESFGAFSIEMYDKKGNAFNLDQKEGKEAEVIFPTNVVSMNQKKLPESVPLLYYDEAFGLWRSEGKALLDKKRMVYIAKVKHFSAVNLDLEKDNPACLRVLDVDNASENTDINPPYNVEVTIPPSSVSASPRVSGNTISSLCSDPGGPVDRNFALTRLPAETEVSIVFLSSTTSVPLATYVAKSGIAHPIELSDRTRPGCAEMQALCGTNIVPFKSDDGLGGGEILVAACKKSPTEIIVSVAVNLGSSLTEIPPGARFRITRADGDLAPTCGTAVGEMIAVSGLTKLLDKTSTHFRVYQFAVPSSALCSSGTALSTEKITVMSGAATPTVLSNEFFIVPCN